MDAAVKDINTADLSWDDWDKLKSPRPTTTKFDATPVNDPNPRAANKYGQIVRFLTGLNGSKVTGLTWSTDKRTMFVGIQHPSAPFPDGEGKLARSTVIAVKREGGALVG